MSMSTERKGPLIERMHIVHTHVNTQKCSSWAYTSKKKLRACSFCWGSLLEGNEKEDGEKACERSEEFPFQKKDVLLVNYCEGLSFEMC